jgi:hypothetical protein
VGARPTWRIAQAGSNRSSYGGNEMAYMSSTESRVFSRCGPRLQLEPCSWPSIMGATETLRSARNGAS